MIGPYRGYPGDLNFRLDCKADPTSLYTEILKPKKIKGEPAFVFRGSVLKPFSFDKDIKPPYVHSILLPFLYNKFPELLNPDNTLNTKYMMTAKYARAEYKSISKYSNDWYPPKYQAWEDCKVMMADAFSFMDDSPLLSIPDSLVWLDKQTSPGYPWSIKYATKKPIIDEPWFIPWYKSWEESVLDYEAEPFYWRCFIKDEVKKATDVMDDNPRTILASPIQATVLGYRLFGVMNDRLTQGGTSFRAPCYVGVTKFNRMWHRLAMHLLHFPNRMHGDATRWDGSVMPPSLEFMCSWRQRCCSNDSMKAAFEYFYENVLNSWIVGVQGDLFSKKIGMPSGQVNTLHDNSLIHCMYWFYHWCLVVCVDSRFEPNWLSFKFHVNLVVMGDDVACSWSNEVDPYMKPSLVAKTFASIGVILKFNTDNDDTNQTIEMIEFCSMHFLKYQDVYVPLMKRDKMIASMFLKHQTDHPRVLLRRLLSIRIEVWFDKYLRRLVNGAIDYLLANYASQMSGSPTFQGSDDCPLDLILTLRWTRYTIEKHYMQHVE